MARDLRISPAEAKMRVDAGEAVILDVVSPSSWAEMDRQIAGAIRIEPEQFATRYRELPRDKMIIAYVAKVDTVVNNDIQGKSLFELKAASPIQLGALSAMTEKHLEIQWWFDTSATNGCQGDSFDLTVMVTGHQ